MLRKRNEVILEPAFVPLGKVDRKRHSDGNRLGICAPLIHRTGTVHHNESILSVRIIGERAPRRIHGAALLLGGRLLALQYPIDDSKVHQRTNDVIRIERSHMHGRLAALYTRDEIRIALFIIAQECPTIEEQRAGRLLFIIKTIVLRPQVILNDRDAAAQLYERLSVLRLGLPEQAREPPPAHDGRTARRIDRGQPFREQRNRLPC